VCFHQGRHYNPVTVNDALEADSTVMIDTNGTSISGYRIVKRSVSAIAPAKYNDYANIWDELYLALDRIVAVCSTLGYDVVRDGLRIVDDVESLTTYHVQDALPCSFYLIGTTQFLADSPCQDGMVAHACFERKVGSTMIPQPSLKLLALNASRVNEEQPSGLKIPVDSGETDGTKTRAARHGTPISSAIAKNRQFL
jgi:hypothetical protein